MMSMRLQQPQILARFGLATAVAVLALSIPTRCQAQLPMIRATAPLVDIRDGGEFRKSEWRISPQLKPDIYKTHSKRATVTFITDLDSICCVVDPDRPFRFVILFQEKDSALTEIRYEPTHLEVLKASGPYAHESASSAIPYIYDSVDGPAMK